MNRSRIVVSATFGALALAIAGCEHPDDRTETAGRIAQGQHPQQVYIGASPPSAAPYAPASATPPSLIGVAVTAAVVFVFATAFLIRRLARKRQ